MIWIESEAEIPDSLMESTFPISVIYRKSLGIEVIYYRTKCIICNVKNCKHFYYIKTKPMITETAHLINKLACSDYLGVDPNYEALSCD